MVKAIPILMLAYGVRASVKGDTLPLAATFAKWVWVGLVFCAGGDILLHMHDNSPTPEDESLFVAGLGSFLIGHLFYIVAFSTGGSPFALPMRTVPIYAGGAPQTGGQA